MSAPSTVSSRQRSDNKKIASLPLDEQEDKVYEIGESLKEYLDFQNSDSTDSQSFCENYQDFIRRSEIYIGTVWKHLRASFRTNKKDNLSDFQQIYINAIESFSSVLRDHKTRLQSYLKSAIENYNTEFVENTLLFTALKEIDKSTKIFFELLSHQIETTREVRMKELSTILEDIYNEEMKLHDACAVALAYEFFSSMSSVIKERPTLLRKTKEGEILGTDEQKDRENCIEKLNQVLYSNESMFAMSISVLLSKFNTQKDYEEILEEEIYPNDTKEEIERKDSINKEAAKIKKANTILQKNREAAVDLILDIFKERINQIQLMLKDIEKADVKDKKVKRAIETANDFRKSQIEQFFDLTFNGLISFLQKVHLTQDQGQEHNVIFNICNLVKKMNASAVALTLKQHADFYALIAGSKDDESVSEVESSLENFLDGSFAQLVEAYQQEIECIVNTGPPATQEDADKFIDIANDARLNILDISNEILPVIVKSVSSFYKAHPQFLDFIEEEEDQESYFDEEEEPINPFEDFIVYFVELSQKHLRTLIPPKAFDDSKSRTSRMSGVSTLSKYAAVRRAENMSAELERIDTEEKLEAVQQNCKETAAIDVGLDIQYAMSAQLTSMILKGAPQKELLEHQNNLKSIIAQTGALLAKHRKVAAAAADIERVQAIDGKIALNQSDLSGQLVRSFEEAMRMETQAWINRCNKVSAKQEVRRNEAIMGYREDLDMIFDRLERKVHIPQLALLEKKILIEEEYAKRKECPESRKKNELAAKLAAQGDYAGAKRAKAQAEAAQAQSVEEALNVLRKKHDRMRAKELEKNAADLERVEAECNMRIKQAQKEFRKGVELNQRKMWTGLIGKVQKNSATAAMLLGDDRQRKVIGERLQKIAIRVLDENDMKGIVPERELAKKI